MIKCSLLYIFLGLASFPAAAGDPQQDRQAIPTTQFGLSHPPFTTVDHMRFTKMHMEELGVRILRISTDWAYREPEPGVFVWTGMDQRVQGARDHGFELLVTIHASGPDWACSDVRNDQSCVFANEDDFRNFVAAFATRYANQIAMMQFGNEWDGSFGYAGTSEDFTRFANIFYEEVKANSPTTQVVLGGVTRAVPIAFLACQDETLEFPIFLNTRGWVTEEMMESYCQSQDWVLYRDRVTYVIENASYDVLDLHLYDDVARFEESYLCVTRMTDKPVIITEFGIQEGGFEGFPIEDQAATLRDGMRELKMLRAPKVYYFNLVDGSTGPHTHSGLVDAETLETKDAYNAFKQEAWPARPR